MPVRPKERIAAEERARAESIRRATVSERGGSAAPAIPAAAQEVLALQRLVGNRATAIALAGRAASPGSRDRHEALRVQRGPGKPLPVPPRPPALRRPGNPAPPLAPGAQDRGQQLAPPGTPARHQAPRQPPPVPPRPASEAAKKDAGGLRTRIGDRCDLVLALAKEAAELPSTLLASGKAPKSVPALGSSPAFAGLTANVALQRAQATNLVLGLRRDNEQQAITDLSSIDEQLGGALQTISDHAFDSARDAANQKDRALAAKAFSIADRAEAAASAPAPQMLRQGTTDLDLVGTIYGDIIDTGANTVVGGIGGSVASGSYMIAQSSLTATTTALSAIGGVTGSLSVVLGAVDLALAIRGGVRSKKHEAALRELGTKTTSPELQKAAAYAADQKAKKVNRRIASGVLAGAAITAGVIGLVALGVATLGIGAVVAGLLVGGAVIGVLIYKYVHKRNKRAVELSEMAESLVEDASKGKAEDQLAARRFIESRGLAPADGNWGGVDRAALASALRKDGESRRGIMAGRLCELLVNGSRSERYEASQMLSALALDPAHLESLVKTGRSEQARQDVKDKLATW